ncbi:MAG: DUF2207 domain-containing protein [Candidatus Micrarchaeota archaeon]
MRAAFILLALAAVSFAFSIDSYFTHAAVQQDGSLDVYENINFTLEKEYGEGFRSIRSEDYGSLGNLDVRYVRVNGQDVPFTKQQNGDKAEIVWKRTYEGQNNVELSYTLRGRAQIYNDFAKVCFEHYGAGWSVQAGSFESRMSLPEAARGKDMHFEVYSAKNGTAYIDDLDVVIEMKDVPPGNYVGGCYLYDKGALSTQNVVNASALQILKDEREAYGSETIIAPEDRSSVALCCLPLGVLSAVAAAAVFFTKSSVPKKPENIIPPDSEEPAAVSALVRNEVKQPEMLAAAILSLINSGAIDIVELEKRGETSAEARRERTVLILKRRPEGLKRYETAILDMLFPAGTSEVDLDALAASYDAMKTREEADKTPVAQNMDIFANEIDGILRTKGMTELKDLRTGKNAGLVGIGMMGLFFSCALVLTAAPFIMYGLAAGDYLEAGGAILAMLLFFPSAAYLVYHYNVRPTIPKGLEEEYASWDAFARAAKASRLREYPPSSALIWGGILVYATALGLADKVKRHMSELDVLTAGRLAGMEAIRDSSVRFYSSAWALRNLRRYGTRHGPGSRHGGFSSRSSGGWSHGGGGGFSSRSSGGGGFR